MHNLHNQLYRFLFLSFTFWVTSLVRQHRDLLIDTRFAGIIINKPLSQPSNGIITRRLHLAQLHQTLHQRIV